jgi:hypothetical protein
MSKHYVVIDEWVSDFVSDHKLYQALIRHLKRHGYVIETTTSADGRTTCTLIQHKSILPKQRPQPKLPPPHQK